MYQISNRILKMWSEMGLKKAKQYYLCEISLLDVPSTCSERLARRKNTINNKNSHHSEHKSLLHLQLKSCWVDSHLTVAYYSCGLQCLVTFLSHKLWIYNAFLNLKRKGPVEQVLFQNDNNFINEAVNDSNEVVRSCLCF